MLKLGDTEELLEPVRAKKREREMFEQWASTIGGILFPRQIYGEIMIDHMTQYVGLKQGETLCETPFEIQEELQWYR